MLFIYYGLVDGSLDLIRLPTEKVGMGLVVELQTMQPLTIVVIFFQVRRVYS